MISHPLIDALRKKPDQPAGHNSWTIEADQAKAGPVGIQTDALRLRRNTPSVHTAPNLARKVAKPSAHILVAQSGVSNRAQRPQPLAK